MKKVNKKDVINQWIDNNVDPSIVNEETRKLFAQAYYFGMVDGMYYMQDNIDSLMDDLQDTLPK